MEEKTGTETVAIDPALMTTFKKEVGEPKEKDQEQPKKEVEPKIEEPPVVDTSKNGKKEFEFDRQKYVDDGITDEKALKILEDRDKKLFEKEQYIGTQARQKGDIRKEAESRIAELEDKLKKLEDVKELDDDEYESIVLEKGQRAANQAEKERQDQINERQAVQNQMVLEQNKLVINTKVPNHQEYWEEMAALIKENAGPEAEKNFKTDPYWLHPAIFVEMASRVKADRQVKELTAEVDQLKKQIKEAPNGVLDRIKKIGANTGSNDGMDRQGDYSNLSHDSTSIGLMTTEQLRALRKQK